jgi:ferredoxin
MVAFDRSVGATSEADCLGLIFPVHGFSIPRCVETFLAGLDLSKYAYLFSVTTKGGSPELSFKDLNRVLRKKKRALDAFFSIEMPNNTCFVHDLDTDTEISAKYESAESRIVEIAQLVSERGKSAASPGESPIKMAAFRLLHSVLTRTGYLGLEGKFYATDACNGCGTCETVCPSGKINMLGGIPVWAKNRSCLFCGACINYCPRQAIHNKYIRKSKTQAAGQYHNKSIGASEIARQKPDFT